MTRLMLLMALTALVTTGWAQQPQQEEPGGVEADEDRARIESADFLRYDPDTAMYYLDGNVVFSHKDIKLYCDHAVYDYDANSAQATGNPRVVDPETTITGDVIEANFNEEVATVVGNVTAVTQKRPEEGQASANSDSSGEEEPPRDLRELHEKKSTITCEKIVFEYAEDVDRITATGRVKAVQEKRTAYADMAVYEGTTELLTVTGNVRILTDRGDEFRCPRAVISIEENWIRAEQVTGVGVRRDNDEREAEQPPPTAEQEESSEPAGEAEDTSGG